MAKIRQSEEDLTLLFAAAYVIIIINYIKFIIQGLTPSTDSAVHCYEDHCDKGKGFCCRRVGGKVT